MRQVLVVVALAIAALQSGCTLVGRDEGAGMRTPTEECRVHAQAAYAAYERADWPQVVEHCSAILEIHRQYKAILGEGGIDVVQAYNNRAVVSINRSYSGFQVPP